MPTPPCFVALAAKTVATSVAFVRGIMLQSNVPVNVFTFEAAVAFETMLDDQCYDAWFCRHLHCSQATFQKLLSMLQVHYPTKPFKKYSFERALACTLFHLGLSGGYRKTAQAFGVSKAWCIDNSIVRVLAAMRSTCIALPQNSKAWEDVVEGFSQVRGFPFCCGAMDGTLIAINRPRDFEGWYNRKDHKERFISFDIRHGSWSDTKIFQYSWFGRNIDTLLPRGHHVLADSGYGVSPASMTPYSEKD
ncbi:DDE superfamily endonuclease, partial [Phytophthora infestans]